MALTCIKLVGGAIAATLIACSAPVRAQAPTDADVLAARDAAQRGQWKVLEAMRPRFAGHPMEPYLAYWALAGSVERFPPGEVRTFLQRHPKGPLAEAIRREWLRSLGASASWELFREELAHWAGDDLEIACHGFQERLSRGDSEVAGEVRALFISGRETPAPCDAVFAQLVANGRIGEAETWDRIHKLLGANNVAAAKRTNQLLPARHRFNEKTLERAGAEPAAYLAREKSPILARGAKELAFHAFAKLARAKPEDAAERLAAFEGRLGPELTASAWGQVAWQAALVHHPRALQWYALARDAPMTDAQLAWRVRAALRARDWKAALVALQALPPEEARDPAWRYWRARALRELGEAEASAGLLRSLAPELHFYGLLAAEETGVARVPDWNSPRLLPEDLERVKAMPGIQRALILYRIGMDPEALREWLFAVRGLDDRGLLAAAELARQANIPDRAINTADRTVFLHDFTLRYPTPHREALAAAAKQFDSDEAILYSIIRQESRFMAEARSRVGATGLMQLMPATAQWVARQIPVQSFQPSQLTQPDLNILMGTYYFQRVLRDLGHPILATAAYNAGPGRARRWRDERALEGAIYVETIPFNETRDYVKKVFANTWFYRHRLTGKPASLRDMLGSVPGKQGEPAALATRIP